MQRMDCEGRRHGENRVSLNNVNTSFFQQPEFWFSLIDEASPT
jgi:hypothetical protein